MDRFSIRGAFSLGLRFIAERWLAHCLILIGLGILVSFGLQYALVGGPVETMRPGSLAAIRTGTTVEMPIYILTAVLACTLQVGSYLASLRFGLARQASPGGALGFGLAVGIIAVIVLALALLIIWLTARPLVTEDTLLLAVAAFLLPLLVVYALFFVGQALLIAAIVIQLVVFLLGYGALMGAPDLAATFFFGSGSIVVLMLVLGGLLFWLAARLSCTTALMAERGSLNLFAAIRDSWRLTWEDQGAITLYFAMVGFIPALLLVAASIATGGSIGNIAQEAGVSGTVIRALITIPFAFFSVILPAGVYRQLKGTDESDAAVFD
jgi:hypothetical protein